MTPEDKALIDKWVQDHKDDPEVRAYGRRIARALIGGRSTAPSTKPPPVTEER